MIKSAGRIVAGGLVAAAALASAPAHAGKTLDAIKARGQVVCGVNTGLAGFSGPTARATGPGSTSTSAARSRQRCSATRNKVEFVPLNAQQRFTALQSGEIDILSRNTTWTLTRDASLGMYFTGTRTTTARASWSRSRARSRAPRSLKGATVCAQSGTTTEKNLADFLARQQPGLKPVVFEKVEAATGAYFSGRCQAYTTDASGLASVRNQEAQGPERPHDPARPDFEGAARPRGAARRRRVVHDRQVGRYGLIEAEEYGMTQKNVDEQARPARTRS